MEKYHHQDMEKLSKNIVIDNDNKVVVLFTTFSALPVPSPFTPKNMYCRSQYL